MSVHCSQLSYFSIATGLAASLHALDEVLCVLIEARCSRAHALRWDRFHLVVGRGIPSSSFWKDFPLCAVDDECAFVTNKRDPVVPLEGTESDADSVLPDHGEVLVFIDRLEGVRCFFGIVGIGELTATGNDRTWSGDVHAIQHDVDQMHTPVRH